ncbi:hypothetical protein ILYODFUR_036049 [Ilyodon furcidens]|uniref:Uncharacterized protein n=1 Tax=Ilyodon furcidens TaxID=33524 RepID=A0ABV0T377_9TELE
MAELLTLSLRECPATLRRKLISATVECHCNIMSVEMNCKVAGELVPISSGLWARSGAHTGQVTSPLQGNYLNLSNLINGMIEVNAHTGKKYYIQLKECFAKVFCSLKQAFFQNKKKLQTVLIIFFQLSS